MKALPLSQLTPTPRITGSWNPASEAGFDIKAIQKGMAHSDASMTNMYLANHELPYEEVKVQLSADQIGGEFN